MAEIPSPKHQITQFSAVGSKEWRLGGKKVGLTPRLIRHVRRNWQLQRHPSLKAASYSAHMRGACKRQATSGLSCPTLFLLPFGYNKGLQ
eukprot:1138821-Pelagomonas_calceolata.AAC.2